MIDERDWARVARYLAGECTPDEADATRRWIEESPERYHLMLELRASWESAARTATSWDTKGSFRRLVARMSAREERRPFAELVRTAPASAKAEATSGGRVMARLRDARATDPRRWSGRVAAAAILVAAISGVTIFVRDKPPVPAPPAPMREIRTAAGEHAEVTLSDGSRVVLAARSVLRYDSTAFGGAMRSVELEGRGFFSVIHDSRRPFLVHTPLAVTEDLGTEFSVSEFAGDSATDVLVASGKVALRSAPAGGAVSPAMSFVTTILVAGERARLDASGGVTVTRHNDIATQLAWTRGELVFKSTPVPVMLAELSRWFALDIALGGRPADRALGALKVTASFKNEAIPSVLNRIALLLHATVERAGDNVTIKANRGDGQ